MRDYTVDLTEGGVSTRLVTLSQEQLAERVQLLQRVIRDANAELFHTTGVLKMRARPPDDVMTIGEEEANHADAE